MFSRAFMCFGERLRRTPDLGRRFAALAGVHQHSLDISKHLSMSFGNRLNLSHCSRAVYDPSISCTPNCS